MDEGRCEGVYLGFARGLGFYFKCFQGHIEVPESSKTTFDGEVKRALQKEGLPGPPT